MKVLSLFSGIGAFEKALDKLKIDYELVNYCEFDKYASKSYAAIHNEDESKNLGDITKVDEKKLPKNIDLITYGFPCQDISIGGKMKGFEDEEGNKTRSGLFYEALRIIEETKPKIAIAENVKNLVSKKFKNEFEIVLNSLEEAGYNCYWKILDSSDYGIPQHRERVFIVSIRKDIDEGMFTFPKPFELKLKLKDMLEDEVDEKYYLSDKMINYVLDLDDKQSGTKWEGRVDGDTLNSSVAHTLSVRGAGGYQRAGVSNFIIDSEDNDISVKDIKSHIKNVVPFGTYYTCEDNQGNLNTQCNRFSSINGISPTIPTIQGLTKIIDDENIEVPLKIKNATKKGYLEAYEGDGIDLGYPTSTHRRGRVQPQSIQTITTSGNLGVVVSDEQKVINNLSIRKLTPLECWRLMGFDDEDINKCIDVGISNTQLYKQAGNSIVVDVLVYLFKEILKVMDMEVEEMKKVEEVKTIIFECDDLIDLAALKEAEPDLYKELVKDYPCEKATYVYKNSKEVA